MSSNFKQPLKRSAWYRIGRLSELQLILITMTAVFLVPYSTGAASTREVKRVLIFYEFGLSSPGIETIDQGILAALDKSPYQIELYREYLETTLFPEVSTQNEFREWYIHKYQQRRPDLIITVGPSALQFMVDAHAKFFKDIPIVFTTSATMAPAKLDAQFSGVQEDNIEGRKTIDAALRLQSGTKHVVVVAGTAPYDRYALAEARQDLRSYESKLDITYLTDLTMPQLLEKLEHLPEHTVVLLTNFAQDATGAKFISSKQAAPMIATAANAPVFSLSDVDVGYGEVGGDVISFAQEGQIVGDTALRILNGERVENIPIVKMPAVYLFDWRALKRWGLKEENLPPGSIVLNREPTVWESYKWYIAGGVSLIVLQALLIGGLLWNRARRRKAENEVRESEQRFRHVANTAPVMIWMSDTDKLCTYVNQPWLDFTNRSPAQELGNGRLENIHGEDVAACFDTYTEAFDRHEPFTMQYRLRRHDGEYRWVLDRGIPRFDGNNSFTGYIGSCVDITDRKLAEEALSSVSRRLIDAQEQERAWIARELHDDISQRIAMVGIEADALEQRIPDSAMEVRSSLDELRLHLSEIGSEIQAISHRLHSSKLEYLGLVPACKGFCKEIAEHNGITVELTSEDVPHDLPREVSLCLFRVLQESLTNAMKHSGSQRFEAHLRGISGEIELKVRDYGIGFDAVAAMVSRGLGLVSMRERVSLVKGVLLIASRSGGGTEITARVPIATKAVGQTVSIVA